MREAASECDGRVLKQIGDEFMLVFPSGAQVVSCGRSIMAKAAVEHQFPDVRLGAHSGVALYRKGDYLGTTVNVAALVASQAIRGQFLVTDAVRRELDDDDAVDSIGSRALKGVSDEIELFEVASSRAARPIDPVCGMVIDPEACALSRSSGAAAACSSAPRHAGTSLSPTPTGTVNRPARGRFLDRPAHPRLVESLGGDPEAPLSRSASRPPFNSVSRLVARGARCQQVADGVRVETIRHRVEVKGSVARAIDRDRRLPG